MSLLVRLAKSSLVYTVTNLLQRGIAFLLLPIYTHFLTPADYGVMAVVSSLNGFLVIATMLGLNAAINRFYFEYRDDPAELKAFWGTVITTTLVSSVVIGGGLLMVGPWLLQPVTGAISFWPFVALGVGTIIFQPFYSMLLNVLQTLEKPGLYAIYSLTNFVLNLVLAITLVVFLHWGAAGPLTATLATSVVFFLVALVALKPYFTWGIRRDHLRTALSYSLPVVPHTVASQISATMDRILLNRLLDATAAGLFSVGHMLGLVVSIVVDSINRAYVPVSMDVLKKGLPEELDRLREMGLLLVVAYCLAAAVVSSFGREGILLLTAPQFAESYVVVPLIAFSFAMTGIYYLLVNVLFYVQGAIKLLPLATGLGAVTNLGLNFLLIPRFGLVGAGAATLAAQVLSAVFVAVLGKKFETVHWNYVRFTLLFTVALAASLALVFLTPADWISALPLKLGGLFALALVLSTIAWNDPTYLLRNFSNLLLRLRRPRV